MMYLKFCFIIYNDNNILLFHHKNGFSNVLGFFSILHNIFRTFAVGKFQNLEKNIIEIQQLFT